MYGKQPVDGYKLLGNIRVQIGRTAPGPDRDHLVDLADKVTQAIKIMEASTMLSDRIPVGINEVSARDLSLDLINRVKENSKNERPKES